MRRKLAALLVGLLLVPPVMAGCSSATEPSFDDEYQAWVGTWVGTDPRLQINLQIRRGDPYRDCSFYSCREYSDLYTTTTLTDAKAGYSATGTWMVKTNGLFGPAPEIWLILLDREVTDTPGVGRVIYTFRGTLEGSQQTTGSIDVSQYASTLNDGGPISTETLAVTLRKQ